MYSAHPKKRIHQFEIGESVIVKGTHYKEPFKIIGIDYENGYYQLQYKDQPTLIVAGSQEVE